MTGSWLFRTVGSSLLHRREAAILSEGLTILLCLLAAKSIRAGSVVGSIRALRNMLPAALHPLPPVLGARVTGRGMHGLHGKNRLTIATATTMAFGGGMTFGREAVADDVPVSLFLLSLGISL